MTSNQVIDMKKKDPVLKTKRMRIQPMSDREIEELIRTSDSDELRSAYAKCWMDAGAIPSTGFGMRRGKWR